MTPAKVIDGIFEPIIGQELAKTRLADILASPLVENGYMAPTLLIAPPGIGKTKILRACKAIVKSLLPDRRTLYFETGKEMGTPLGFFEQVLNPYVHGKEAVLFVDEFHEAPGPIQSIVRSMVEITTNREPKTIRKGDYEVTVNPLSHGFFLATNKIDSLDPALVSRFERIDLSMYSDVEMEGILFQGLQDENISFFDNTLRKIAQCNRGSARDVVHWINAIRRHLALRGKKSINKVDVAEIIRKRETYPCGVSMNELNTLLLLEKHGEQQMKELAAKNLCSPTEQNANEKYLLQRGYMTIDGKRYLTQAGREYLASLREDKFIDPAPIKRENVQVD